METTQIKQKSQKDGVYDATMTVLANNNIVIDENETPKSKLTPELRKAVIMLVHEGFVNKTIALKKAKDPKDLRSYAATVTGNWLNKDKRITSAA